MKLKGRLLRGTTFLYNITAAFNQQPQLTWQLAGTIMGATSTFYLKSVRHTTHE